MMHPQIQEDNIADRYVMKKLSAEERSNFEEHLVDCQECLDRVETLTRFRRGLRVAASHEIAQGHVLGEAAMPLWFRRLGGPYRRSALGAGLLLLLLAPAVTLYLTQVPRTRHELERMRAAYAELQQRYAQQQHPARPEDHLPAVDQQRETVAASVDRERRGVNQAELLSGSLPLFTLSVVRDPTEQLAPSNQVRMPSSAPGVILSLEFDPVPEARWYRARLFHGDHAVWSTRKLAVSGQDNIAVILNRRLLATGNYVLQVEDCSPIGCYPASKYSFVVTITN